jgi:hypothetical protein
VTRPSIQSVFVILLIAAVVCGCDRSSQAPESNNSTATTQTSGNGVITGRVLLTGNIPPALSIAGSPMVKDETIVAGSDGSLKNVIVFLKNAPASGAPPQTPALLDQINCVYVPHVIAMQAGQILRIQSSDNVLHNVQLMCTANPSANLGFPSPGHQDLTMNQPESPFRVKCDVHPWMGAWIAVFDHPWFAVTGDDGRFTISHIPAGNYILAAWQEALPQQEQPVSVTDSTPVNVQFNFQAP